MIPYSKQSITDADVRAVVRTLRSAHLTQGPAIERFEKALAKHGGAKYAVAVSSGTAALHMAYHALGIGVGDEVIVPALTFAATANAALYCGATPVFADIDPDYGTMDARDVETKITARTKAIVAVDYAGRPADLDELKALARKYNILFIEDGAQSLGASYRGKPVGAHAVTMVSFHPVKSITTGEGGAILTNDVRLYKKMRTFRTHGITKDPAELTKKAPAAWYQEMQMLGFNYRITDIQAALGESQLKRLKRNVALRRRLAKKYDALLKNIPGLILPLVERQHEQSAWHLYPVRVDPKKRDAIFTALRKKGIGVQVHYIPVYFHPYYEKLGYKKGICPRAERYSSSVISIPLFPTLTGAEQKRVVQALRQVLEV